MNIFVINLERSEDRRIEFDKNNSKYIKYTYSKAIDGRTIDINCVDEKILVKNSQLYTNFAVGCALSHLQLWEKCIELDEPIIILEDDAIVSCNFMEHIKNLPFPEKWDIIQLNYNFDSILSYNNTNYETCNCIFGKKNVTNEDISIFVNSKINSTIAKLNYCFGTSAYIINPNGARILKEKCFPMNNKIIKMPFINNLMCYTIDCMMNSAYKEIDAYVSIIPFVITPHYNTGYKTTFQ